ncbi:MAG: DUF2283 domain-containing protein [Chloroflexi bacterium]|nr:DUF2283 domain-containing protein [Chloroflexota bacterium]
MKITYDPKADALYIQFQKGKAKQTRKLDGGLLVDFDEDGKVFGIEIIGASERMSLKELGCISLELPIAVP